MSLIDNPLLAQYPALADMMSKPMPAPVAAPAPQRNFAASALSSGIDQVQQLGGAFVGMLGNAVGSDTIQRLGEDYRNQNAQEAAQNGRPDLEVLPSSIGGIPKWAAYQAIKQIPTLGALLLASRVPGINNAAKFLPAEAKAAGAYVPELLGGGGARLGAATTFAQRKAGVEFANRAAALTAAGYPISAGSLYDSAMDQPNGASRQDAVASAIGGVPYAALEALAPRQLEAFAKRGLAGGFTKRVATGVLAGAATEMPVEGAQTAMEMAFRPDLTPREKADQIVSAAITGGVVGGIFGGSVSSVSKLKTADPTKLDKKTLTDKIDADLGRATQTTMEGFEESTNPRPFAKVSDQELQQAFAAVQQRKKTTGEFASQIPNMAPIAANKQDMLLEQQLRAELDRRQYGEPSATEQPPVADGMVRSSATGPFAGRNTAYTETVNPNYQTPVDELQALQAKYDNARREYNPAIYPYGDTTEYVDRNQMSAADIARINELQDRPDLTPAAPREPGVQPGFDLFDAANIPLARQDAPRIEEAPSAKELTEAQKAKATFLGESKAKWAQDIINDPASSAVDLYAGIIRAINSFDAQRNASVPKKLLELGQKIGLFNAENQARDLAAEYDAAVKKNDANWAKVKLTQTGAKEAAAYQNSTLKPLEEAYTLLSQAQAKIEQESQPSPVARPTQEVPPPVQSAKQSAAVFGSRANQLRLALRTNNPAVERGDTAWLERQQRQAEAKPDGKAVTGSMTAWTGNAVDLPVSVLSKLPTVNPPSDSDQTKVDRLSKLVERNGWNPQPISIVVNHRGEAYVANGKARLAVARKAKQKSIPVNIEWMNGAELTDSQWAPTSLIASLTGQPVEQMPLTPSALADSVTRTPYTPAPGPITVPAPAVPRILRGEAVAPAPQAAAPAAAAVAPQAAAPAAVAPSVTTAPQVNSATTEAPAQDTTTQAAPQQTETVTTQPVSETVQRTNENAKGLMSIVKNIEQGLENLRKNSSWREFSLKFTEFHLKSSSATQIAEFFGAPFKRADGTNILKDWVAKRSERTTIQQRLAHLVRSGYLAWERLPKDAREMVSDLMGYSYHEVDPRKTWAEHTWLHGTKNEANLIKLVQEANKTYRTLRQKSSEGAQAYADFISTNEAHHYIQQALSLYNLIKRDQAVTEEFKNKIVNPMTKFLADETIFDSPKAMRDYWFKATGDLITETKNYLNERTGVPVDEKMKERINASANNLRMRYGEIEREQASMAQAPYFHIGRFGPYVLKFKIRKAATGGVADPAALERIAKAFADAKIDNVVIPKEATRSNAFLRFESLGTRDEGMRVAKELERLGFVSEVEGFDRSAEIGTGEMEYDIPESVQRLMDSLKGTQFGDSIGLDEQGQKLLAQINKELKNHITQHFMNLLPDTATSKVMVQRNAVPGFSPDMMRSYVFRTEIASRAIASLATASDMSDLSAEMTGLAKDLRSSTDTQAQMVAQRTVNELLLREAERPTLVKNEFVDMARAFTHTYFLGMSPSYVLTQQASIPVMLWPELSKKYGFVNSAKAIARVTPTALKVLRAVLAEAAKSNWRDLPDATITRKALSSADIKGPLAEFLLRITNSGAIDIGTQTRELGRISEGLEDSKAEQFLRWGASFGYYSEMYTRVLAALAAREVHGGNGEEMFKYAENVVRQSMFDFSADNIARATGRRGMLGSATPLFVQFQQYMFQATEKLMREFHSAFTDRAATAEEKKEARRFLGVHLGGMLMVSGALGLPMAAVVAKVIDKMADALGDDDDEPFNSQIALRNWLNMTFGDGIGNVVARGVPRQLGFDISKRVGEQDMFPFLQTFSKLITDRRRWDEAIKEWAANATGSTAGMVSNILTAGDKLKDGDILGAGIEMAPAVLRGPLQTYKMGEQGYADEKGNTIPMTPSELDYFYQFMGLTPAQKADYSEMNAAQASLKSDMMNKSRALRKAIVTAMERGDTDAARNAILRAQQFDAQNPDHQVLPGIEANLGSRLRERLNAQSTNTGLGVKRGDADYTSFFKYQ